MTSGNSKREYRIHCSVCGAPTPHRKLGDTSEQDHEGHSFQRMECCQCGSHTHFYPAPDDEQPETDTTDTGESR